VPKTQAMARHVRHRCWRRVSSSLADKRVFVPASMPVYHPREPSDSPLWKILHNHYEDFKAGYDEHCEKHYGFFRSVVDEVVEEYFA